MQVHDVNNAAIIVLTTNRGLCGALNINTVRFALEHLQTIRGLPAELFLVGIGKVGLRMLRGVGTLVASFTEIPDRPGIDDVLPLARLVIDGFSSGEFDSVDIIYPKFVNTLIQQPVLAPLLPVVLLIPKNAPGSFSTFTSPDQGKSWRICCRAMWKWSFIAPRWN